MTKYHFLKMTSGLRCTVSKRKCYILQLFTQKHTNAPSYVTTPCYKKLASFSHVKLIETPSSCQWNNVTLDHKRLLGLRNTGVSLWRYLVLFCNFRMFVSRQHLKLKSRCSIVIWFLLFCSFRLTQI